MHKLKDASHSALQHLAINSQISGSRLPP